mgnify:CR=1 FL=1
MIRVAEEYELSRRKARRIRAKAKDLIVEDFGVINLESHQRLATFIVNLQELIQKGLLHIQISEVAAASK